MTQPVGNFDPPIMALASRYPELLHDLQAWARANPASTQLRGIRQKPLELGHGGNEVLFNHLQPEGVLPRLSGREGGVLHVFSEVAGFLHFLTQPAAIECIVHPNWAPLLLLPLEHAPHMQQWLLQAQPRRWPWALLNASVFPDVAVGRAAQAVGQQMVALLEQLTANLASRIARRYMDRPTPAAVVRQGQRPLRVLVWAYEGSMYQQFCARDISDALGARGVEVRAVISVAGPAKDYELAEAVESFDPDVLLLNGRGRDHTQSLPGQLCILTWDQDHCLCHSTYHAQKLGGRDLLMVMVDDWRRDAVAAGFPRSRTAHVNLGTNHRLYREPAVPQPAEYDVLFVGNIHPFETYRRLINFDEFDELTQSLLLRARQRLGEWLGSRGEEEAFVIPDSEQLLRECSAELGLSVTADERHWRFLVNYFRYRIAHLLVREVFVSSLTEFRLGLFGRGWEHFPAVAAHARPEIENGPPLREAIHRAAINLHLHTWTVHHPRLYDTAAAGGFLLVGRVPEAYPLQRVFTPGEELDTFGCIAELKRKIRHYLANPEERVAMAGRAADRARREHTMEHRAADMLRFLAKDVYDDQ